MRMDSWRAIEKLYSDGLCKSIGVSNYMERHIDEVIDNSSIIPAVNQVEFSPFLYLVDLKQQCESMGIVLESYSPLTKGYKLEEPRLILIAEKYGKSTPNPFNLLKEDCLDFMQAIVTRREYLRMKGFK